MKRSISNRVMHSAAILLFLASFNVNAWNKDESNRAVHAIGAHAGYTGYVQFVGGLPANCENSGLYFDVSTPLGKSMLATLLTAKATGRTVRIGYVLPPSSGMCSLEMALLQ